MAVIKNNHINYYESLHTQEMQRGEYVRINDNLIQFDFDRRFGVSTNTKLKGLDDNDIKEKRNELNRIHI